MKQDQDLLYRQAGEQFAPVIARLARTFEHDAEKARDLEQDIHCALWRSFERFQGKAALKTWVYRVAHNVAADHVARAVRRPKQVALEDFDTLPDPSDVERGAAESHALERVKILIRSLKPIDAQVMLLWLEGESGDEIAEICGLTLGAVQLRIHRARNLLTDKFTTRTQAENQP